jgi:hypothetical protein
VITNLLILALVVCILLLIVSIFIAIRSAHAMIIKHALISNFSRFGEAPHRYVIANDSGQDRGFFLRDGALWTCEVLDGEILRTTTRPIDMYTEENLEGIYGVVTALTEDYNEME